MKIIYTVLYFILLLGLFDLIAYTTDISLLKAIHSLFINVHFFKHGVTRIQSVYFEPGYYAEYLFMFMPILFTMARSKYQIFKSKKVDKFIKKTTVPLFWFSVIFSQSPIWIVCTIISAIIYYYKFFIKHIKFVFCAFLIIISVFFCIIKNINLEKSFAQRIINVVQSIDSLDKLIYADESLGTRISCMINLLDIGSRTPIFGAGPSNMHNLMYKQISQGKSKIAVTKEMYVFIVQRDVPKFQNTPLSNIFIRYGLIGIFLYYYFLFSIIIRLKKLLKYTDPIIASYANSFAGTVFSFVILTCYDISTINFMAYFLVGIALGLIQYIYNKNKINKYLLSGGKCAY